MGSVLYLDRGMRRTRTAKVSKLETAGAGPSILRPGYNVWAVARAERVAFLVDAADYFRAFYEAALRAKRSILILGWDFNSQTQLHFDPVAPGQPPATPVEAVRLGTTPPALTPLAPAAPATAPAIAPSGIRPAR